MPPIDCRSITSTRASTSTLRSDVNTFLTWMYWSVAETLPELKDAVATDVIIATEIENTPDLIITAYDQSLSGSAAAIIQSGSTKIEDGHKRHLPPGCWYDSYLLYAADRRARGKKPASFPTFWRTWKDSWCDKLAHRTRGTFGKCGVCVKYKELIKMAINFAVRERWIIGYENHLLSQYRDREVYYYEREQSVQTSKGQLTGPRSTATMIIDAMDQAKFACPRHLPNAKSLQDAMRPRLHVVGVRVAGYFKRGYIIEPTISKDGDLWMEIIYLVLQDIVVFCRTHKIAMPQRLVIVSDNAGDNKSGYTFSFCGALMGGLLFRVLFQLYLRTGHSHEDIDAMFGLWAAFLTRQKTLQTPYEFRNALRKGFPDTQFYVMSHKRLWSDWLGKLRVSIGGMGGSVNAAHSFTWARRQDYDAERFGPLTSRFEEQAHALDVIPLSLRIFQWEGSEHAKSHQNKLHASHMTPPCTTHTHTHASPATNCTTVV